MSDVESFAAFVTATQASLRRTAYLVCGDWDLASDHVQEGLIRVYRHWRRLDHGPDAETALRAYARKAVVNVAIDAGRRRSSREIVRDTFGESDRDPRGDQGHDPGERWHEQEAMMSALGSLSPGRRACVVLRYYEDLSVTDVASTLGISEGTVKSQTAKGLAALETVLRATPDAQGGSLV